MQYYLEFDAFDNPMQLSKVGHWVITFMSPPEEIEHIVLAISSVLPRQLCEHLQPRRVLIQKSQIKHHWLIQGIECFDSTLKQELILRAEQATAQHILSTILEEFEKYEVNVQLKSF